MSQSNTVRTWFGDNAAMSSGLVAVSSRSSTLQGFRNVIRDDGHRGTRQRYKCRTRVAQMGCGGNVAGYFSPAEMDFCLNKVLGSKAGVAANVSSGLAIPGDTLTPFYSVIQKDGRYFSPAATKAFLYKKLRMNSLEISGRPGQYLLWTADMLGEEEVITTLNTGGSFAAQPECEDAFVFSDVAFSYDGTVYPIQSVRLRFDNALDPQTYENSVFQTRFEATDLVVTLDVMIDFRKNTTAEDGSTLDHRPLFRNSSDVANQTEVGATGILSFSGLSYSGQVLDYAFNFHNLQQISNSLPVPVGGRMVMPITYMASRNSDDTDETDETVHIVRTLT